MTDQSQSELLARLSHLKQSEQPVVLSTFGSFAKSFCSKVPVPTIPKLPKSLRDYYSPNYLNEFDLGLVYKEQISKEDKDFIERSTREQGNSIL